MAEREKSAYQRMTMPVLSIGRDRPLMLVRQRAMDGAGIPVRSLTPEQAERYVRDGEPRIWVLCASIELVTLLFLACGIRRYSPVSRLVLLEHTAEPGIESSLFHRVLDVDAPPQELVTVVNGYRQTA